MTVDAARAVRSERAQVLAEIALGRRKATDVLRRPPACARELDVYDVVRAIRGFGRDRTRVIFERADVWPHTHVDELTAAQRTRLIDVLPT